VFEVIDPIALGGSAADYVDRRIPNLLDRWSGVHDWYQARRHARIDPYCRRSVSKIAPYAVAVDSSGRRLEGINFASQDYLNLSSHPAVIEAACRTAQDLGVHSAGSVALMGGSSIADELEQKLADFLQLADCTLFPTGWGAGYGIVKTLTAPGDHILIDVLAHASLKEGAAGSGAAVYPFRHNSVDAVERLLKRIRQDDSRCGILIVTETLFSMDSDTPNIAAIQTLAKQYDATLVVDVAHDLGSIGPKGGGFLELQSMTGKVDVVMGSFSKSFASNGGFVATNHSAIKLALRSSCGPILFTNALSPIQAAIISKSLDIIRSPEGADRRARMLSAAEYLRKSLSSAGFDVLGVPSAIVPTVLGSNALSRLITRLTLEAGILVNLAEHPAVPRNSCRWRLQVMADHRVEDVDKLVAAAVTSRDQARKWLPVKEEKEDSPSLV
jgi:glycine C-acetyltransferase